MDLLKEELHRIVSRKIVKVSFIAVLFIQVLLFTTTGILQERSVINGQTYTGLAAIKMDREITKPLEGELTWEKMEKIAADYGFVDIDAKNFDVKSNYLNSFLYDNNLTNGYLREWEDYKQPTELMPLKESDMGKLLADKGDVPTLAYTKGWRVFENTATMAAVLVCLWSVIALTPVFAEEYSMKTVNIVLTTVHGKKKDILMRFAAAFLFTAGAYVLVIGVSFLLCGSFYGFGGLDALYGSMNHIWYADYGDRQSVSFFTVGQFFAIMAFVAFLGLVMLTSFVLLLSAVARQPFTALIVSLLFYVAPLAIWLYLNMINEKSTRVMMQLRRILMCSPVYCCISGSIADTMFPGIIWYRAGVFAVLVIPSLMFAFRCYRNHQVDIH